MAPKPMKPHDARCDAESEKCLADDLELCAQARERAVRYSEECILTV